MLVIRLFRTGKKNQPFFKIVVTDKRSKPKAGRFVEEVGFYNPLTKEKNLKTERIKHWLSVGAKPSETIHNLLVSEKIIEDKKIPLHKKSKKEKPVQVPAPAVELAPTPAPMAEEKSLKEKTKEESASVSAPATTKAIEEKTTAEDKPQPSETPTV